MEGTVVNHDTTLIDQIAQLSAEQAQEAVQLFYELMPNSWWADQEKLSQDDIDFQAKMIQRHSNDDVKPLLKALSSSGNTELKGEIARGLLREFANLVTFATSRVCSRTRHVTSN